MSVAGTVVLAVLLVVAVGLFVQRVYLLYSLMRLGQADGYTVNWLERIRSLIVFVLAQGRVLKEPAGIGHAFIFWGFLVVSVETLELFCRGLTGANLPIIGGNQVFLGMLDAFQVAVVIAILVAYYRRHILHPERLKDPTGRHHRPDADIILTLILSLMISAFFYNGFRLAALTADEAAAESWLFVGYSLSEWIRNWGITTSAMQVVSGVFYWIHILLILGFLIFIPYSKHLHLLGAPLNVFFRNLGRKGELSTPDLENSETFGVNKVEGFSWKDILDAYACTECGRCQVNCPAYLSQQPLSPKGLILNLRDHVFDVAPKLVKAKASKNGETAEIERPKLIGDVYPEEMLWACTTCRSCMEQCPVFIEHVPKIIEMRRNLVLEEGSFPQVAQDAMKSLETRGHPWRGTQFTRTDWIGDLEIPQLGEGANVDVLFFVGCSTALDERNMRVASAMAKIMKKAGVNFGILGAEEPCCGDPARRIGNEYLYQMLAQTNVEMLNGYNVKKIVTVCPHCFNTLKNEYPKFGGNYEVVHHSEFLTQLVDQGKIKLTKPMDKTIAYHDPCYAGRYNGIYDSPRRLLRAVPGLRLVEMERNRAKSFCCGGGGGHVWMEEHTGRRINHVRTEQALEVNPGLIGTACPFCTMMFEDGVKVKDAAETVRVVDIAEVVEKALQ